MKHWWAKALLALTLFVFLAVVLVVGFLHTNPGRKRVLSWLQDYLFANQGIRLQTQEVQYNLFELAVTLRHVRLSSRAAPDLPPILTADRMYIDLSTMSLLLHGFLAIEEARIDSPVVRVVILKNGRNNIPASQKQQVQSSNAPSFLIESARLGKGSFFFTDEQKGIRARLGNWQTSIEGTWSTMSQEVKLTGDGEIDQDGRKVPISALSLQAAVPSNLKDVTIHDLDIRNPEANIHVTGKVDDLKNNPNFALKVTTDGDLARVSTLAEVKPPITGRFHVEGDVRHTLDTLNVSGRVTGDDVSYRSLDHVNLSSRVLWDMAHKRLTLSDLSVRSPEADLHGQANVSTEPAGRNNASLDISRLDLEKLMKGLDVGVRLASHAKGRVEASWTSDNLDTANVTADLQLTRTAGQPRRDTLPLSGSVVLKKQGAQAQVRLNKAESLGAAFKADIRVSSLSNIQTNPNGRVSGEVSARVADLLRLTSGLARFLGKPGPLLGTQVAGPAELKAQLGGTLQQPTAKAQISAPSTQVGNLQGVALDLGANYQGDRVTVDRGVVSWKDERLLIGGSVSRLKSSDPALDLSARLDNGSVASFLQATGQNLPVTGRFKLLAGAKGTVKNPQVTANIDASGLQAYGEALGTLAAEANLQNRTLVAQLSLQKPNNQGKLDINGQYNLDTRAYDFKADAPQFELTALKLGKRILAGILNLTGSGSGTVDDPRGTVQLNAENLRYGDDQLGNLQTRVDLQNRQAIFKALAPRYKAAVDASLGVEQPHPVKFDVKLQGTDFSTLPFASNNPPAGNLQAEITGAGLLGDLKNAKATARVQDLTLTERGQTIRNAGPMTITYENQRVKLDSVKLTSGQSSVELRGSIPVEARAESGQVTLAADLDLGTLSNLLPPTSGIKATGHLTAKGNVKGNLKELAPDVDVRLDNGSVTVPQLHDPVNQISLAARIEPEQATVNTLQARIGNGSVTAQAKVPYGVLPGNLPLRKGAGPGEVKATVKDLDLRSMASLPEGATGKISLDVQAQAPRPDIRAAKGTVRFGDLTLDVKGMEIRQAVPTTITLADGRVAISQLRLTGQGASLQAGGSVQLTEPKNIDLRAQGQVNPAIIQLFASGVDVEGQTNLQLTAKGTVSKPVLDGFLDLNRVQARVEQPDVRVNDLSGRVTFNANRVQISRLTGNINGGTLQASGGLSIQPSGPRDVNVEVKADDFFMDYPEGLRTGASADLRLTSPEPDRMLLSGTVLVHEGAYTRSVGIWTELLNQLQQSDETQLVKQPSQAMAKLKLNIKVNTEQPIVFDNNLAKLETSADLRLTGNADTPGLTGRINVEEGGQIHLRERDYTVTRGTVHFVNETRIEPVLDVQATTKVNEYDVTLQLQGPADNLKATFTSDPALPEPDVIALLVTGRRLNQLRGQETEVAKEQALSMLSGGVGRQIGAGIQEATGLSEVRIEPQMIAAESDPSARLTVAEDITHQLELMYSMNLVDSSDQIYLAQYDISRRFQARAAHYTNAKLSSTQTNRNLYRFDFNHQLRFGGGQKTGEPPRKGPEKQAEIASVSFTGNHVLPMKELQDKFGVEAGKPFDYFEIRKGIDRLRALYRDQNYLEARIRLHHQEQAGKVNVAVDIDAGQKVALSYQGAKVPDNLRKEVAGVWADGVFDAQRTDDAVQHLRAYFIKQDHFQPKVTYEISQAITGEKDVVFNLQPGPQFKEVQFRFPGATQISPNELSDFIRDGHLKEAAFVDPKKVQEALTRYYGQKSFLEADVDKITYEMNPDAGTATVVIPIKEGKLYRLESFSFNGNKAYTDQELANVLSLKAGDPYDIARVRDSVQAIEQVYRRKGYTEVEVNHVPKPDIGKGTMGLEFDIKENAQKYIAEIDVKGEAETSQHLVRNQIKLKQGDLLDPEKVAESRVSLYDTGAFALVEINSEDIKPSANPNDGRQPVRLIVSVREVKPFEFRYGGSYDTERGVGGVTEFINRNSLGKARVLGFRGRYDQRSREVRSYFTQPRLLYLPLETTFSAYGTRDIDPEAGFTTDRLGLSIRQEMQLKDHYILSYGYRFERTRTLDDSGFFNLLLNVAPLSATFSRDTRDDILAATKGGFLSNAFEWAPASLGSGLRYVKYYGQFFRYIPLRRPTYIPWEGDQKSRLVYAGAIRVGLGQGLGGQELIPGERFFAGGETTVRGFRRDALGPRNSIGDAAGGEATFIMNHEIRFPLFSIFDGVGFVDAGNVWANVGDFNPFKLRAAYGLGLRIHTPYVLIRADYGLKFGRRPDESAGAFFVSIGQAF